MAWFVVPGPRSLAFQLCSEPRPVSLHVHIGDLFPPLALVNGFRNGEHKNPRAMFGQSSRGDLCGSPQTIYVGFRLPEFEPSRHRGNVHPSVEGAVIRPIARVLKDEFHYKVVKTTFDQNPGFWYPYLGTDGGNVVFCRLLVDDCAAGTTQAARSVGMFREAQSF
jgi:hypothetical protein